MKINNNNFIKIMALLILLLTIFIGYLFFLEPNYKGNVHYEDTLLIVHRGFGNYAPDNSFSAVEKAIDFNFDGVDLDAQLTADDEIVIFHDPTLKRLTNGLGEVRNMTLEEIKTLDAGYKFHENYAGEKILTLEEMIKKVDKKIIMIVELKSASIKNQGLEQKAINYIRENDAYDYVYLSSFNPFIIYRIEKIDSKINTVFIFRDIEPYDSTQFAKIPFILKKEPFRKVIRKIINPDILSMEITVNEKTIETLRQKGYPIFLWSPNNVEDMKESLNKEPFGIITDEPFLILNLLEEEDE